jgi:uncharacterized protein YjbI with pentapeptide repeats
MPFLWLRRTVIVVAIAVVIYLIYRASAAIALDRALLATVPAAFLVAVALIYFVPRYLIPDPSSSKREEIVSVIQARNELRKTGAQLLAGVSFVLTFLLSIYNFNRDFTQRTKQSAADQFSKAIAQAKDSNASLAAGGFYLLAQIARDDATYHEAVFRPMAEYLVRLAKEECFDGTQYKDQSTKFELSLHVQFIARVFINREVANDDPWHPFNFEDACLSRVYWVDAGGGVNLYMPRARLLRADMRNAILRKSNLQEVLAGVDLQTWEDIEKRWDGGATIYRANFEGANLSLTNAFRANFKGASFARADLEDASWQEAKLQFANMEDANLFGIDLTGAELDGSNLEGARLDFSHLAHVVKFERVKLKNTSLLYTNIAHAGLHPVPKTPS